MTRFHFGDSVWCMSSTTPELVVGERYRVELDKDDGFVGILTSVDGAIRVRLYLKERFELVNGLPSFVVGSLR
jgi:hypothetical protein